MSADPSWYDLLDVDPSASPEEIRAAWKAAIAELDPTDRRFRVLNQAAEVLLDPASRAEYDQARRASAASEPAVVEEVAQPPSRDQVTKAPSPAVTTERTHEPTTSGPRVVPGWLLIGLALATLLFVALSVWQAQQNEDASPPSASGADSIPDDARDAQEAAERAAVAITAYDFRDLDGSRAAAVPYMTEAYQEKYDRLFAVLEENAPNVKTIVKTQLVDSAVGLIGEDRIQVLVFFDRSTTNAVVSEPQITRDQATLTMANEDGEWLVDDLSTTLPGS